MAALDTFEGVFHPLAGPYKNMVAITPNDATDLGRVSVVLMVGGGGTVKIDTLGGQSGVTFTAVAGYAYRIRATRVYATGTTATGIVSLY